MVMAYKNLGSLLRTTRKVYKSPTTIAFQPRLTTDGDY